MTHEEHVCKNCRYYIGHFVKSGSYLLTSGGHCINDTLNE